MVFFTRPWGFLSSCWTNSAPAGCNNIDKHHRRRPASCFQAKYLPWNSESLGNTGNINSHHIEKLLHPSFQNNQDRKAVCSLQFKHLYSSLGSFLFSEKNHLHGLLLHSKLRIVQHTLSLPSWTEAIHNLAEPFQKSEWQDCPLWPEWNNPLGRSWQMGLLQQLWGHSSSLLRVYRNNS